MTPDRWQQIDALLDLALEQEPSQRASFLAEACNGDEALRREVEALLAAHDQAGSFLVSPTSEAAAQGVVEAQTPSLAGQVIGPYQILSVLGKGGMGEVYLAQDSRLGRKIALKLLPGEFTQDRDRLRRFEREARAASALNHPNILTIHEIGEQGGNIFIATEFIEGQTLRQEMAGGALPSREVLDVAVQVASALGAAHAAGIVHRDIKPENIMLRRDGLVKVLDFGLAKLSERPAAIGGAQEAKGYWSETESGAVMGTTRYMSPEQARGLKLDVRTDLFSLGVVMYEIVTGRPPFEGETATDVIIAIVEAEPLRLSQLAEVPTELEKIVTKALSKNVEARYQTATELESDLKGLRRRLEIESDLGGSKALERRKAVVGGFDGTVGEVQQRPLRISRARRFAGRYAFWIVSFVLVLTLVLFLAVWRRTPPQTPSVLRTVQITSDRRQKGDFLLTDGPRLYFSQLLAEGYIPSVVSTSGGEVVPIPTSLPNAIVLDISPQSNELLVNSGSALWVLPTAGGTARRLGDLEADEAATWSPDGEKLVFIKGQDLYLAKGDGTGSRKLVSLPGPAGFLRWAPDGKRLTVSVQDPQVGYNQLWEVYADGSNLHPRFPDWKNPPPTDDCSGRWTSDGRYFLFDSYRGGPDSIWVMREKGGFWDKGSREPVRLTSGPMETGKPLPSKDGRKVFFFGLHERTGTPRLMRYDSKSRQWVPYLSGIAGEQVDFSRDGQWIAYVSSDDANLIRSKVDGSQLLQLTSPPEKVADPRWSPDGRRIAFVARTSGHPWKIHIVSADGTGARQLMPGDLTEDNPEWSPDGNSLIFRRDLTPEEERSNAMPIHVLDLRTNRDARLPGSGSRECLRWSPDGRYLAATADLKKVVLFDFNTQKWVELTSAGDEFYFPRWSRDMSSIYFIKWTNGTPAYFRLRIRDRKVEQVTDLNYVEIHRGTVGGWVGLAPDDSPMALVSTKTQGTEMEIYALDWDVP